MNDPWIERWYVPKSDGDGHWVVARKKSGRLGCSCPVWKFSKEKDYAGNIVRKECHHIRQVRGRTDGIDSAEMMARIASLDEEETYQIIHDAYIQAGYMTVGYINDPPEDWQKQKLDELKHDTKLSLVCLAPTGANNTPMVHFNDRVELMVKSL